MDAYVGYARKHKLFLPTEMVCTKTLYNEVWAGNLVLEPLELPEALKRKKVLQKYWQSQKSIRNIHRRAAPNCIVQAGGWTLGR